MSSVRILVGDVRERLRAFADESVHCVVTSPPYWNLRDYDVEGQIGREPALSCEAWQPMTYEAALEGRASGYCCECWVCVLVEVFREVRRVLRPDGTVWLNLGDSYNGTHRGSQGETGQRADRGFTYSQDPVGVPGLKPKDLLGQPWRLAFALQADGWWLRRDIVWEKLNVRPESAKDRPTTAHEYVFILSRSEHYYYDDYAVREAAVYGSHPRNVVAPVPSAVPGASPHRNLRATLDRAAGRNARSVWPMSTKGYPGAHFATFPEKLPARCILAGTSERGCCPSCGAPWQRQTERSFVRQADVSEERGVRGHAGQKQLDLSTNLGGTPRGLTLVRSVGWAPTCGHGREPIPCVVLDPFGGAGTTALAAARLGRDAMLVELNRDYAEMSRDRIVGDLGELIHDVELRYYDATGALVEEVG